MHVNTPAQIFPSRVSIIMVDHNHFNKHETQNADLLVKTNIPHLKPFNVKYSEKSIKIHNTKKDVVHIYPIGKQNTQHKERHRRSAKYDNRIYNTKKDIVHLYPIGKQNTKYTTQRKIL